MIMLLTLLYVQREQSKYEEAILQMENERKQLAAHLASSEKQAADQGEIAKTSAFYRRYNFINIQFSNTFFRLP
jgi:hypothetical protein